MEQRKYPRGIIAHQMHIGQIAYVLESHAEQIIPNEIVKTSLSLILKWQPNFGRGGMGYFIMIVYTVWYTPDLVPWGIQCFKANLQDYWHVMEVVLRSPQLAYRIEYVVDTTMGKTKHADLWKNELKFWNVSSNRLNSAEQICFYTNCCLLRSVAPGYWFTWSENKGTSHSVVRKGNAVHFTLRVSKAQQAHVSCYRRLILQGGQQPCSKRHGNNGHNFSQWASTSRARLCQVGIFL